MTELALRSGLALSPGVEARSRVLHLPPSGSLDDLLRGCPARFVFTNAEQRYCGRRQDLTGWGGRLAAKLAVADLLGIDGDAGLAGSRDVGLARIEVLPDRSGVCRHGAGCLRSHPPVVSLGQGFDDDAREDNDVSVSISHTRALAIALAVRHQSGGGPA